MINQNWVFGKNASLRFLSSGFTIGPGNAIDTKEGCASISDAAGNILFYTDGVRIWDGNNNLRYASLLGHSSSSQSAIIVPDPGNSSQYYVLTTDGSSHASPSYQNFNGVVVDVATWSVVPIPASVLPSVVNRSPTEKLTAIQNEDCTGYWVITVIQEGINKLGSGPGYFRIFRINSIGIHHHMDIAMDRRVHDLGYLKGNSGGTMLALANSKEVLVYDFDPNLGEVVIPSLKIISTSPNNTPPSQQVYGVEFSPNSQYLYYSDLSMPGTTADGYVYQVDLLNANLPSIQVGVFANPGGERYAVGALQLAIDGKIYIAKDGESSLGAILDPDMIGGTCDLQTNFVTLPPGAKCYMGLPNLLPNPCSTEHPCTCECQSCNQSAESQNAELIERAQGKFFIQKSDPMCAEPYAGGCTQTVVNGQVELKPCFYFHWGDGANDQIEEHDTEVFYLTVCNPFEDVRFEGLHISKVSLNPNIHSIEKIHIVPDRLIHIDCLAACSCQTREFAIITRANDTAGNYTLEIEYCFGGISIEGAGNAGKAVFNLEITED